jgi:hypothetical protein
MLWLITPTTVAQPAMHMRSRDEQRIACVDKLKVSTTQPRLHPRKFELHAAGNYAVKLYYAVYLCYET